jgi:CubicO group peptidase (beta-lactamase class C family)
VAQVNALFANATHTGNLPGMVVTVTINQTQAFFAGYGKRDARATSSPKPSSSDLVWIASITKTFTSLLMFQLRDEGLISLDDPVANYFPANDFGYKSIYATAKTMTLRQLASHTSGLTRSTPYTGGSTNETEILAAVKSSFLVVKPGTVPKARYCTHCVSITRY